MNLKELKVLKTFCEYLGIKTAEDLEIVKKSWGASTNKQTLHILYLESTYTTDID